MAQDRAVLYGKGDVLVYRTYAAPLKGITPIPESSYTGDDNVIFAWNLKVVFGGEAFLTSFTEGDNSQIVATDSMKNFILRHAADYPGATIEGFLHHLADLFLNRYSHLSSIELSAERLPFQGVEVPGPSGRMPSSIVFSHSRGEAATAEVKAARGGDGSLLIERLSGGISKLHLIKVKGSSFAGFVRDEYTTLPEAYDRPLFIYLNISWTYTDVKHGLGGDPQCYIPAEQIRDVAVAVFHELYSPSIQHLLYRIGQRALKRFPQMATIQFESNNRTWETVIDDIPGEQGKVFTEPRPPYGFQLFTMIRSDADEHGEIDDTRTRLVTG
ncbi:factor-independent urate hydroxylase [Paenibacillus sp. GCM10023252]|uniref:factor-independent urate hydroxylase n=1 Tax=Paenibacillus sp. GCM10023252 TaxID=3252649 RepID=UPI00361A47E6